ncbi:MULTISPECIES: hypothetical protein [Streptomyces]|uniref:(2Fe-2S)-binding protein n=1 Tax=Streptomyces galilaeus TaxID=33899 RepID=A0ABW9IMP1_STRGJ
MSHSLAFVRATRALEQRIALITCDRSRQGKTQACDRHRHKARALLNIASQGAIDALTAAICGHPGRCQPCGAKAIEIVRAYNEGAE